MNQTELLPAKKTGAANNRGNSKQDYETPWAFIHAVEARYGKLGIDLAATAATKKAERWIDEASNSLKPDCFWHRLDRFPTEELLWLNPEFGNIAPWAKKCAEESAKGARILLLVPASVDSNYWRDFILGKAWVDFVSPRVQFVGAEDPFPKPLALCAYNIAGIGYGPWRWKP